MLLFFGFTFLFALCLTRFHFFCDVPYTWTVICKLATCSTGQPNIFKLSLSSRENEFFLSRIHFLNDSLKFSFFLLALFSFRRKIKLPERKVKERKILYCDRIGGRKKRRRKNYCLEKTLNDPHCKKEPWAGLANYTCHLSHNTNLTLL